MKLIHYTNEEFELDPKEYPQSELNWQAKPNGLWISVEGEKLGEGWKEWCQGEEFRLEHLIISYQVILKEEANILHLKTAQEIYEFSKLYPLKTRHWDPENDTYQLSWEDVKAKYQGIIISPYQWQCRMDIKTCWYYGWDCSSGCIWDLTCIAEFKLIE